VRRSGSAPESPKRAAAPSTTPSAEGEVAPDVLDLDLDRIVGALDALPDGVLVVDQEGNEVARNQAAERFRDARHGDALAEHAVERLIEGALQGERGEEELALFGPPRGVLQVIAVPLRDTGGGLTGAAAFVRDITEPRRVENIRRDFVANVSHELKTPIGALALLAETIGQSDDVAVIQQLADQLVKEADRLARIVDDLLDLSMIEAQEAPTRETVAIHVLLEEAADRLGPMALAHGIPLRVEVDDRDAVMTCDSRQLLSAITNLLDNAVKYSEPGNTVTLSGGIEGDRVVISVRDEGIGIPATDLERIFERFYRVDRARSRATGGTGLGLAIVRHVAAAHGGDVSVSSVEGEGSTFRLSLPAAGDAAEREPRAVTSELA
jgi:two-component system, OmpR family, sensor histidine kinase SenX3